MPPAPAEAVAAPPNAEPPPIFEDEYYRFGEIPSQIRAVPLADLWARVRDDNVPLPEWLTKRNSFKRHRLDLLVGDVSLRAIDGLLTVVFDPGAILDNDSPASIELNKMLREHEKDVATNIANFTYDLLNSSTSDPDAFFKQKAEGAESGTWVFRITRGATPVGLVVLNRVEVVVDPPPDEPLETVDKFPDDEPSDVPPARDITDEPPSEAPPAPSTASPEQQQIALELLKRTKIALGCTDEVNKRLNDRFDDVRFLIFVPKTKSLRDQTFVRANEAGLIIKGRTEDKMKDDVLLYVWSKATERTIEIAIKHAADNPRSLIVIVADECHFGVGKTEEDGKRAAAMHKILNNEKLLRSENVVRLLISATPANVLTKNSRVSRDNVVAWSPPDPEKSLYRSLDFYTSTINDKESAPELCRVWSGDDLFKPVARKSWNAQHPDIAMPAKEVVLAAEYAVSLVAQTRVRTQDAKIEGSIAVAALQAGGVAEGVAQALIYEITGGTEWEQFVAEKSKAENLTDTDRIVRGILGYWDTEDTSEDIKRPQDQIAVVRVFDTADVTRFIKVLSYVREKLGLSKKFAVVCDLCSLPLARAFSLGGACPVIGIDESWAVDEPLRNGRTLRGIYKERGAINYTDLKGLACFLLLINRGRMGDTFSHSFAYMDLRLRDSRNAHSTFVQEFGRLCRYVKLQSKPWNPLFWEEGFKAGWAVAVVAKATTSGTQYNVEFHARSLAELRIKAAKLLENEEVVEWSPDIISSGLGEEGYYVHRYEDQLPSIVLSPACMKPLKEAAEKDRLHPIDHLDLPADSYVEESRRMHTRSQGARHTEEAYRTMAPKPNMYDHENIAGQHDPRRLLLWAQCQQGKTGVYLALISMLRAEVCEYVVCGDVGCGDVVCGGVEENEAVAAKKKEPSKSPESVPEEADDFLSWVIPFNSRWGPKERLEYSRLAPGQYLERVRRDRQKWMSDNKTAALEQFKIYVRSPRGEMVVTQRAIALLEKLDETRANWDDWDLRLRNVPETGRVAGWWEPPPNAIEDRGAAYVSVIDENALVATCASQREGAAVAYREFHLGRSGAEPPLSPRLTETWAQMEEHSRVFIPNHGRMTPADRNDSVELNLFLRYPVEGNEAVYPGPNRGAKSWCFVPSYSGGIGTRAQRARLDYSRVLDMDRVVVVVVRESEIDLYLRLHGNNLIIVAMPEVMNVPVYPGNERVEVTDALGGIGYARLFIQLLAYAWGLPSVWMMDDNILQTRVRAPQVRDGRVVAIVEQSTSQRFEVGMKALEHCFHEAGNRGSPPEATGVREPLNEVVSPQKIALLGMVHGNPMPRRIPSKRGFLKTHSIYAFVLLNVTATVRAGAFIPPKRIGEDVEFIHLLDELGFEQESLLALKCSRLSFTKVNLKYRGAPLPPLPPPHGLPDTSPPPHQGQTLAEAIRSLGPACELGLVGELGLADVGARIEDGQRDAPVYVRYFSRGGNAGGFFQDLNDGTRDFVRTAIVVLPDVYAVRSQEQITSSALNGGFLRDGVYEREHAFETVMGYRLLAFRRDPPHAAEPAAMELVRNNETDAQRSSQTTVVDPQRNVKRHRGDLA